MAKAKKPQKRRSARKTSLAGFLKKMWKSRDMMEKFSADRAGREQVISKSNLLPRHKELLLSGCVHDIVKELVGVPKSMTMNSTTIINDADEIMCEHEECHAFMAAMKPTKPGRA